MSIGGQIAAKCVYFRVFVRNHITFILWAFVIGACQTTSLEQRVAENYLPSVPHLRQGVVNKYYYHVDPGEGAETYTDITYVSYRHSSSEELLVNHYNAGLELSRSQVFVLQREAMLLKEETYFSPEDTLRALIHQPYFLSRNEESDRRLEKQYTFLGGTTRTTERLISAYDTTILDRPAKVFENEYAYFSVYQGDTTQVTWTYKKIYALGFGLFGVYDETRPNGQHTTELVEQMSLAEFQRRARHGRHRVAYINPETALDREEAFVLCGSENAIADYYNSDPDGQFAEGKQALVREIRAQVDPLQLGDESGYLTFRFVVNCRGEAGRFTIEQASLDFQKKEFAVSTIKHLYRIVNHLAAWRPCMIEGEARDAYFYVTFRLVHGEIKDILP